MLKIVFNQCRISYDSRSIPLCGSTNPVFFASTFPIQLNKDYPVIPLHELINSLRHAEIGENGIFHNGDKIFSKFNRMDDHKPADIFQ